MRNWGPRQSGPLQKWWVECIRKTWMTLPFLQERELEFHPLQYRREECVVEKETTWSSPEFYHQVMTHKRSWRLWCMVPVSCSLCRDHYPREVRYMEHLEPLGILEARLWQGHWNHCYVEAISRHRSCQGLCRSYWTNQWILKVSCSSFYMLLLIFPRPRDFRMQRIQNVTWNSRSELWAVENKFLIFRPVSGSVGFWIWITRRGYLGSFCEWICISTFDWFRDICGKRVFCVCIVFCLLTRHCWSCVAGRLTVSNSVSYNRMGTYILSTWASRQRDPRVYKRAV